MLRVTESKNADAAKQYFGKSMVRSDYYSEGQEIAGLWEDLPPTGSASPGRWIRKATSRSATTCTPRPARS